MFDNDVTDGDQATGFKYLAQTSLEIKRAKWKKYYFNSLMSKGENNEGKILKYECLDSIWQIYLNKKASKR